MQRKYWLGWALKSSPTIDAQDGVYVSTIGGILYALNPDGSVRWNKLILGTGASSPALVNGNVVVGSSDGKLRAFARSNGALVWSFDAQAPITGSPAVDGSGNIVFGTELGFLRGREVISLNAAGALRWRTTVDGPVVASPAIDDQGTIFATSNPFLLNGARAYALRMSDGSRLWTANLAHSTRSSPAVISGRVYFGSDGGRLVALRAADGVQQWSYAIPCGFFDVCKITSSPAIASSGEIIFGALNGYAYAVRDNGTSASLAWSYRAGEAISASPAIAANRLVYLTGPAGAYALDVQTGALRWRKTGFACADSSPAIDTTGAIWTAGDDGFVRVFKDR